MSAPTLVKKSVTIRGDLDAEVKERTEPGGYSAFVNDALEDRIAREKLREWVEDNERRFGPVSEEMLDKVRADQEAAEARRLQLAAKRGL